MKLQVKLEVESTYKNGKSEGLLKAYYPSGKLKRKQIIKWF